VPFLRALSKTWALKDAILSFNRKIIKMQKRIKDGTATKAAKLEILNNYWDKIIGYIGTESIKKNDPKAKELMKQFILVPKHIRQMMLEKYAA
jgi:hypothetical protein